MEAPQQYKNALDEKKNRETTGRNISVALESSQKKIDSSQLKANLERTKRNTSKGNQYSNSTIQ